MEKQKTKKWQIIVAILLSLFLIGVIVSKDGNKEKFISRLPAGVTLKVTKEKYDSWNGRYSVEYTIANNGDSTFKYAAIQAKMYINGKVEFEATGGVSDKETFAKGNVGNYKVEALLPNAAPDSVVFYLQ